MIQAVTDADFKQTVLTVDGIVLVDFWAPQCSPCVVLSSVLESVLEEAADRIKVFKIDANANPKTAATYGVRVVPMVLLFKNGKLKRSLVGLRSQKSYLGAILRETRDEPNGV